MLTLSVPGLLGSENLIEFVVSSAAAIWQPRIMAAATKSDGGIRSVFIK
jgi:hypothetical protein